MLSTVAEMTMNIDHENLSDGLISTLKFGWVVYQSNGEGQSTWRGISWFCNHLKRFTSNASCAIMDAKPTLGRRMVLNSSLLHRMAYSWSNVSR
jgi:hypothetical protein